MLISRRAVDPVEIRTSAGHKQLFYFGDPHRPLFGIYHPPHVESGTWRGTGVVLCNPLGTDQTRSDRTYRHLAERLARAGFACLRFDFYGTGDSGGDDSAAGLVAAWREDVEHAVRELRERSGASATALVGLRLGGTLALQHAAERGTVDSLVLWSPCVSGAGFVKEVTGLHKVYARIEPQLQGAPPPGRDGEEALGLFLSLQTVRDLSSLDLLSTPRSGAQRILFIDGGQVAGRDALLKRLGEVGPAPELRTHTGHKFLLTVSHRALVPDEILESIVMWLAEAHPKTSALAARDVRSRVEGPADERLRVFGKDHPLFAVHTPANPELGRPSRPTILFSNAGCVNRSGPHRLYVALARRWAALGFDVVRLDLSGIGESPAPPGTTENLTYPPSGMDDLRTAISAFAPNGAIVVGLCSGGDYAFQLGGQGDHIAGAWMCNPRTFCVLDLAAVESGNGTPPNVAVEEVPKALRAMAERGVDALLLVSRLDPGVSYVDAHASLAMKALSSIAGFRRVELEGTDHTFTPVGVQQKVAEILTEHLERLWG
jgi:alpha-beta hydrolase superfamily lysophospholipase